MTDINGVVEIKDFTDPTLTTHAFKIRDDIFYAVEDIPLGSYGELLKLRNITADNTESLDAFFNTILTDESAARFIPLLSDKTKPIGPRYIKPLVEWLIEVYGLRPTTPSLVSGQASQNEDGSTSSTDSASQEVSTVSL